LFVKCFKITNIKLNTEKKGKFKYILKKDTQIIY